MNCHLWIKRYFAALNHYKWQAAGSFALVSAIAGGMTMVLPANKPTYLAQTTLIYKPASEPASTANNQTTNNQTNSQAGNQSAADLGLSTESLLSEPVLKQTSDRLKAKRQLITPDRLRNQISLSKDPTKENRFLIQYRSDAGKQSKLVVGSLVDAINHQSIVGKRQEVEASLTLLENRKGLLEDKLRVAEEKLREFSRLEKPAIQAAVDGSLVSAITNIQQQQRQFRREIEGVDAEIVSIQSQLGMTPEQAYVASALSADTAIAGLTSKIDETNSQIKVQRQELQPKHPDIIALEHQKDVHETRLQQRIGEIVRGNNSVSLRNVAQIRSMSSLDKARQELANKLVNLQTQRRRLAQELRILNRSEPQLRQNYRDGTELKLDLEKRTKEVARYREASDQTEKQLAAIELKKAEARSDWLSDGSAQVKPEFNWFLNRPIILLIGSGLGLLVAGTVVLLFDVLRGKVLIPEEVQAILQQRVPLLGILPIIPKQVSEKNIPVLVNIDSPALEPYELLRSSLQRHSHSQPLKVVVLSSTTQGEGKTVSAYNLAIASARAGKKTLLIEANLRISSQAQALKVTPSENESSSDVAEYMQIENVQPVADVKNLFVLPSPGAVEQVTQVLESNQIQQLLKQARDDFDFIVIDTTALRFSDALLIEPHTDGLVLVTRPGYSDRNSLKVVIEKLTEFSNIKLLGAVMNHVAASRRYAHLQSL